MPEPLDIPTPPRPRRLNRLALVAVLVLLGVAITAVFLTLRPPRRPKPPAEPPEASTPARPGFLDREPAGEPPPRRPPPPGPTGPPAASPAYWQEALRRARPPAGPMAGSADDPADAAQAAQAAAAAAAAQRRQIDAELAAAERSAPEGAAGEPQAALRGSAAPPTGSGRAGGWAAAASARQEAYRRALVAPVEPPAVRGATARGAAAVGEPASGEALNGALSGEAPAGDPSPGAGERRSRLLPLPPSLGQRGTPAAPGWANAAGEAEATGTPGERWPRSPKPPAPAWPQGTLAVPGWAPVASEDATAGPPAATGWAGAGAAAIGLPAEPGIAGATAAAASGGPGALPPGVAGAALASGAPAAATPTPAPWPAPPRDHQGFLRGAGTLAPVETRARRDAAGAGLVVDAGTIIPAALLTAVDSDVAGPLVAQVTRDVFDRDQRRVAIPRGSRLLGAYDSQVALGESRLLVAWTRVIFPDGTGLSFPGLPAATPAGEAGLPGSVDNHLARVFGGALLLSVVGAGAQLSQPQESVAFGTAASARQIAAAAVGQQLSSVAIELLRRQLSVPPTIRIAAGTAFNVLLRGDLRLEAAPVE